MWRDKKITINAALALLTSIGCGQEPTESRPETQPDQGGMALDMASADMATDQGVSPRDMRRADMTGEEMSGDDMSSPDISSPVTMAAPGEPCSDGVMCETPGECVDYPGGIWGGTHRACSVSCASDADCGDVARCADFGASRTECVPSAYCTGTDCTILTLDTLAEARALEGVAAGTTIFVSGRDALGDGGGGVFIVNEDACEPDGGLCFSFEEDLEEISGEMRVKSMWHLLPGMEEPAAIDWGSVSMEVFHPDDRAAQSISFDDTALHGHRYGKIVAKQRANLDHATGEVDGAALLRFWGNRGRIEASAKIITTPRRLQRVVQGSALNTHWFGARTDTQSPGHDNQPAIGWAINAANALNDAAKDRGEAPPIDIIALPMLDTYYYSGTLEIGDGLTLQGAGGTELVDASDDLGHDYKPVRVKGAHTRLKVEPGTATLYLNMAKEPGEPGYLPHDHKSKLGTRMSMITAAGVAQSVGLKDIVLDGNLEGNKAVFEEDWASHDEKESMRNTPSWAGFAISNHGAREIPIDQDVRVENVAVLGYGANGILGHANSVWTVKNLRLGNSAWNHTLYNTIGTFENLTFEGFAWGHAPFSAGDVENLVYEAGAPAPYREGPGLIGVRGGDAWDAEDLATRGSAYLIRTDGTVVPLGTRIRGFYLDLRGSTINRPFGGLGPGIELYDGVIIGREDDGMSLFNENGNGHQKGVYPGYRFENVELIHPGDASNSHIIKRVNITESVIQDITARALKEDFTSQERGSASLYFSAGNRGDRPGWDRPQSLVYRRIRDEVPRHFIAGVNASSTAAGMDVFVLDSSFNNRTNTIYTRDGVGTLEKLPHHAKLRIFFEDVTFNMGRDRYWQNVETFFATTRFRRVTDRDSGATSEESGTLDHTATEPTSEIEWDSNLLWTPQVLEVIGGDVAKVDRIEVVESTERDRRKPRLRVVLSTPLAAGESISVNWEAAVRPWDEGVELPAYAVE